MSAPSKGREWLEAAAQRLQTSARSFSGKAEGQAAIDLRALIDPEGEAVASLVDDELSPGAAALALPIDLITFETWVLGHLGDRDELDLDVNTHEEVWFGLGAWMGETLRARHGGFWLFAEEDPRTWRVGFSKIMLEIAPHAFAEKLLQAGQGLGKRVVGEIDRIRQMHEEQAEKVPEAKKDRYQPQDYARMHQVPLSQWMVLELAQVVPAWAEKPTSELRETIKTAGAKLPPQNAPILGAIDDALGKLDQAKPAGPQVGDRGLYEAVAQVIGLRKATTPIPVDVMERVVFPAAHMGVPAGFPELDEDDTALVVEGEDLFAVMTEVVPWAHPGEDEGLFQTFAPDDLGTPYTDRRNLDVGKGEWVAVNPNKLAPMLEKYDPQKLLEAFDRFVEHVGRIEGIPRRKDNPRTLAETTARVLLELRACVGGLKQGHALVFRLLPPPG